MKTENHVKMTRWSQNQRCTKKPKTVTTKKKKNQCMQDCKALCCEGNRLSGIENLNKSTSENKIAYVLLPLLCT